MTREGWLLDIHDELVHQNQHLGKQVLDDMDRYQVLLEAARFLKLRSERRARIARDWLVSDEASGFIGN